MGQQNNFEKQGTDGGSGRHEKEGPEIHPPPTPGLHSFASWSALSRILNDELVVQPGPPAVVFGDA